MLKDPSKMDERMKVKQESVQAEEQKSNSFTMAGVLHFIQHEWSKHEAEKSRWEMEKAELQARISFLQGERRGQEILKADLIRRIKMLEFCVKQERAKNYRLLHNGDDPPNYDEPVETAQQVPDVISEVETHLDAGALSWKQGRQLLKQYLQEIGFSENVMDARAFRVNNILRMLPENDFPLSDGSARLSNSKYEESSFPEDSDDKDRDFDALALDAQFDFLNQERGQDEWASTDQYAIDRLKETYKNERERKRPSASLDDDDGQLEMPELKPSQETVSNINASAEALNRDRRSEGRPQYMDIDNALGLPPDERMDINDTEEEQSSIGQVRWNLKATLRSHWDSLRAMQFHPVEPVVFTASEDSTIKMWLLDAITRPTDRDRGSVDGIEPLCTLRGHMGPVLCMDLSPTGDILFSGGRDGKVCCWRVPSTTYTSNGNFDPRVLTEVLQGHEDAVWSIAYHSSDNRLVSASSDGSIKVWEPGNIGEPLLRTIKYEDEAKIPTSVDFVSTEPSHLLAAYTNSIARIIDIESGNVLLNFDFGEDFAGLLSRIISHPTMPLTIVAGSDRKIYQFDNDTGKVIHATTAHVEAISCLAIDPNGLYLLSGGHDGSLRLWNIERKLCLQEISAHRKKFDASVNCVAFHPSHPMIGCGGADALAKIYTASTE